MVAFACVDTRSGNYCAHYTDIEQKVGDHELNLSRTHNSMSTEIGWFGYGWSTPFETRLIVMPDGSVVVQDPNSRKSDRYTLQGADNLQTGVEKIVSVAAEKEVLGVEAASALRSKLLLNEEFRQTKVRQYGIQTELTVGSKLQSTECGKAIVTRTIDGYQRINCSKGVDYFDLAGRLVRQEDGGYKITIHYKGDRPDTVTDSLGQKLDIKWTATGQIVEARANKDDTVVSYRHDDKDNLVFFGYADGRSIDFEYDATHKIIRTRNVDNAKTEMQYDEVGRIASVLDDNGSRITYTYRNDPEYPSLHHWTTATTIGADGKQTIRVAEYFSTLDLAGVERLSRVIKTDGTGKEEIILDEKEHFKHISKPDGSFSDFAFHPTLGKLTVVTTNEGRTDFSYDKQGNLIQASSEKGHVVILGYDRSNNIIRMVEKDKAKHKRSELNFTYNAQKKPIKISMIGKGTINVEYDNLGEITKVDSKQGAKMALEVSRAFQGLLSLVKVTSANYCL
jgi:YD repeat-containing protein